MWRLANDIFNFIGLGISTSEVKVSLSTLGGGGSEGGRQSLHLRY